MEEGLVAIAVVEEKQHRAQEFELAWGRSAEQIVAAPVPVVVVAVVVVAVAVVAVAVVTVVGMAAVSIAVVVVARCCPFHAFLLLQCCDDAISRKRQSQ